MRAPDPLTLTLAWTAGTALAAAAVVGVGVGTRGLRLLISTVTAAGVGTVLVLDGPGWLVGFAVIGVLATATFSQHRSVVATGWLIVAIALLAMAVPGITVAFAGDAIATGCITVGLSLGHWFLVDPHLPRGPMRALGLGALAGLALTALATFRTGSASGPVGTQLVWVVIASGTISALALTGALASLNVPTYKGVQSATGLFYVCTMSAAGFIILAASLRAPL